MTSEKIVETICNMAKKGIMPSKIGMLMRDQFGVGLVNHYTGSRINRILRAQGLASEMPEDLYFLIKRAVSMRKHLERNPSDTNCRHHLILVESRIYRLSRYFREA